MQRGYGITFDKAGSWSFDNDFGRNVIIFGVDNSSLSYSDNRKNKFLITDEVLTYGINGSFRWSEKKINISFSTAHTPFCLIFYIMLITVICLLMEKKYLNLKPK